jgi:hypothetical protein
LDDYYGHLENADRTVRRIKPESAIPSAYGGLQDAPSPSGKLSDRIDRLRQRCIEALGRDAFMDAYNFLKQHEMVSYFSACLFVLIFVSRNHKDMTMVEI